MTDFFEIAKSITKQHHEKMGYPIPKFAGNDNQRYQHQVIVWNFHTAMRHFGVFDNREDAERFMTATIGHEKSYSAQYGNYPYGTYSAPFSVEDHMANWGNYESNGND